MAKYLNTDLIFKDRTSAGEKLAEKLISYKFKDPIVIALPRGGVAVAKPISDKLNASLSIIVSKKIGAPKNPELAIGAVTSCGDYVIAPYLNEAFYKVSDKDEDIKDYLQKQIVYLINDCRERENKYDVQSHSYENQNVILVDDGTATGMTALAAIKSIKKQNPAFLVLAIPVISSQAYDEIEKLVDKIEALKIPRDFIAVGVHYESFDAVSDDKIRHILS